jgi:hypothetical protein
MSALKSKSDIGVDLPRGRQLTQLGQSAMNFVVMNNSAIV